MEKTWISAYIYPFMKHKLFHCTSILNTRFSISFSAVIIEKCIYMSPPGVRWITAEDGYRGSAVVGIIPRFIPVSSHLAGFVETNVSLASARLIAS